MLVARHRSTPMRLARAATLAATFAVTATAMSGCYRYVEVPLSQLQTGVEVRARLTGAGVDRLRQGDPERARQLQGFTLAGRVDRADADSLVLSVDPSTAADATRRVALERIRIAVPTGDLRGTDLRQVDGKRTFLTVGTVVAATVVGTIVGLKNGGKSTGSTPGPNPPPESRVP